MKRRTSPLFIIILFWIIFGNVGGLISGVIGLVSIVPIVIAIVFAVLGIKIVSSVTNNTSTKKTKVVGNKAKTKVINKNKEKIDKVLTEYFKDNVSLPVVDDIALTTKNGTYTNIDELYITYKEEKVAKFKELDDSFPDTYNKIVSLLDEFAKHGDDVLSVSKQKREEQKAKKKDDPFKAQEYIDKINDLNRDLVNEEVTNGLYQTCDLLKQIDLVDREDGKPDEKLNKLYEYYLPILIDILNNYNRLSQSAYKTDEFKKCEVQLIKTISLINQALQSIYGTLHENDYLNLNADITTLQSLLKKDGFGDNPFDGDK